MSSATTGGLIKFTFVQLWLAIILLAGWVSPAQGERLSLDTVYSSAELSNRVMDVLLRKSKGIDKVGKILLPEPELREAHVYQLQVSCLDLARELEKTFTMVPCPLVVAAPQRHQAEDLYSLSAMLLAEVRRLAVQLNIWGLPEDKGSFKGKTCSDIFAQLAQVYQKLRLLGELPMPGQAELADQLSRAAWDMDQVLATIDPAQRYRVKADTLEVKSLADLSGPMAELRKGLNEAGKPYKLPPARMANAKQKMGGLELFLQSQIVLAEVGRLKRVAGSVVLSPLSRPQKKADLNRAAAQLATLSLLVSQVETVKGLQ